jgi:hypothetical protein
VIFLMIQRDTQEFVQDYASVTGFISTPAWLAGSHRKRFSAPLDSDRQLSTFSFDQQQQPAVVHVSNENSILAQYQSLMNGNMRLCTVQVLRINFCLMIKHVRPAHGSSIAASLVYAFIFTALISCMHARSRCRS